MPAVIVSREKELRLRACIPHVFFGLIASTSIFSTAASAQGGIQQFEGHVSDPSGAAIPGATVTIHNEATGVDVVAKTTGAGDYTAPYLKPGTYTISVKLAGFKEVSKTNIHLDVDQTSKMDFSLPPGEVSETVSVNADAVQIELSKADRGEVIDNERIEEEPSNGRQVLDLFALSPGAIQSNSPQYTRQQDNVSQNLQANGVSINAVAENIDGATNDNAGNYMGYNPPLDSVGSFKVVLNAYDASYGRSAGAAVDISLKSGTNSIHGDLYEFARRGWLDSDNWIYDYSTSLYNQTPVGAAPPLINHKRDQFGAEVDGPVVIPHLYNGKDKTFFLMQWEQSYESSPSSTPTINSVPNPAWLTGNFAGAQYFNTVTQKLAPLTIYDPLSPLTSFVDVDGKTKTMHSPFPGNIIPQNCTPIPPATACSHLDPVGVALANYYAGVPGNTNPGAGFAPFQNNLYYIQVQTFVTRNGTVKLDQVFGPHDRGTLRWGGYEAYNITNPNGIPASDPANEIASQVQPSELQFALDEVHTFSPNLLLDNKAIVSTYKQGLTYGTRGNYLSQLGFSQNLINNATIKNMIPYITATSNLGGSGFVPLSYNTPGRRNISHEVAYEPSLTYIRGRHSIRAGLDLRLLQYTTTAPNLPSTTPVNSQNLDLNFTPTFTGELGPGYAYAPGLTAGNSIASLLIGDPASGSIGTPTAPFYSQHYEAPWVQDDWKVTPKLTLNIGVRYDLLGARTERHNQLTSAFNTTSPSTISVANLPAGLQLLGGLTYAGVNGAPRGAYAMGLNHVQPRFGAAYAVSSRTSLRLGFGEFFVNDETVNTGNGFSTSTSYNSSLNNGITPYGHLSDPFPSYVAATGASLGLATGAGGSLSFVNPNLQIPSVWISSVSLEQQLSSRDILDISYSSSRAYSLPGNDDINHVSEAFYAQCDVERGGNRQLCDGTTSPAQVVNPFQNNAAFKGTSYITNATISSSAFTRPFPQFTSVTETNLPLVHTWYNSMQVVASHNVARSFTLHFAYTWAKNMQAGNIIDTVNRVYGRSLMATDVKNALTFSGVYYLPFGRDRTFFGQSSRLLNAAIGGFEVAPYYVYSGGVPWFPSSTAYPSGTNFRILSPLYVTQHDLPIDGTHTYKRLQGVSPCVGYEDSDTPGLIHPGPTYTASGCTNYAIIRQESNPSSSFANDYSVQQNIVYTGVRLPAQHQFDASVSKRIAYNERINLQLRVDVFNLLNHPNWSQVSGTGQNLYSIDPTSSNWGTIQKGPQGPTNFSRELQLSGKLVF